MIRYQLWHTPKESSYTLLPADEVEDSLVLAFLDPESDMILEFYAEDHEQAIARQREFLGW